MNKITFESFEYVYIIVYFQSRISLIDLSQRDEFYIINITIWYIGGYVLYMFYRRSLIKLIQALTPRSTGIPQNQEERKRKELQLKTQLQLLTTTTMKVREMKEF